MKKEIKGIQRENPHSSLSKFGVILKNKITGAHSKPIKGRELTGGVLVTPFFEKEDRER